MKDPTPIATKSTRSDLRKPTEGSAVRSDLGEEVT